MEVRVRTGDQIGLGAGQALDALIGVEVELHPELLTLSVDPLVGVRAVAVFVAERLGDAALTHEVGDLVGGLGVESPEIPLHLVVAQAAGPTTLLRADEVRELHGVADEEDRGVVTHEIPVALVGVELEREAAGIAPGIGGAELTRDRGETRQHVGLGAWLEEAGLGVGADVFGGLEVTEGTRALGVHDTLWDALAVEVSHLLDEVRVVQHDGAVGARGERVPVRGGWRSGGGARSAGVGSGNGGDIVGGVRSWLLIVLHASPLQSCGPAFSIVCRAGLSRVNTQGIHWVNCKTWTPAKIFPVQRQ